MPNPKHLQQWCEACRNRTTTLAHHFTAAFAEEKKRRLKSGRQVMQQVALCCCLETGFDAFECNIPRLPPKSP